MFVDLQPNTDIYHQDDLDSLKKDLTYYKENYEAMQRRNEELYVLLFLEFDWRVGAAARGQETRIGPGSAIGARSSRQLRWNARCEYDRWIVGESSERFELIESLERLIESSEWIELIERIELIEPFERIELIESFGWLQLIESFEWIELIEPIDWLESIRGIRSIHHVVVGRSWQASAGQRVVRVEGLHELAGRQRTLGYPA